MSSNTILRLGDVEKVYQQGSNKVIALQKTKFEIDAGEFVVIMGTSGSGKTTLLNIIGGMIEPSSGTLFLRDKKIHFDAKHAQQLAQYRKKEIGVVFQDFNLIDAMTVNENIAIPLILDGEDASSIKERTSQMLKRVSLEQRGDFRPYELSGGQQQRVALARALIKEPTILLADEPTGNLDFETSKAILELLVEIKRSFGQTIIMVTHDPLMAAYGERILFMHDGMIKEELQLLEELDLDRKRKEIIAAFYDMKGRPS